MSITALFSSFSIHACYTYAYMESGRVSWGRRDGRSEAGCLLQRRAEIHNLWRENPAPALLGKSCKSLHFIFLLAPASPDHTWRYIFRGTKFFKVKDDSLTYSHRSGRDFTAFMFNLCPAATSKVRLLWFCRLLCCGLWFILKSFRKTETWHLDFMWCIFHNFKSHCKIFILYSQQSENRI